jgi:hypothetical protein
VARPSQGRRLCSLGPWRCSTAGSKRQHPRGGHRHTQVCCITYLAADCVLMLPGYGAHVRRRSWHRHHNARVHGSHDCRSHLVHLQGGGCWRRGSVRRSGRSGCGGALPAWRPAAALWCCGPLSPPGGAAWSRGGTKPPGCRALWHASAVAQPAGRCVAGGTGVFGTLVALSIEAILCS